MLFVGIYTFSGGSTEMRKFLRWCSGWVQGHLNGAKQMTNQLLTAFLVACPVWATVPQDVPVGTVAELETKGSDNNGGCYYNERGSSHDYSVQNSAQLTIDGTMVTASVGGASGTTVSFGGTVGHTVSAAEAGNCVQIWAGSTATAGFYEIHSVSTSANTWTLYKAPSTGGVFTGAMGGALQTIGMAGALLYNNFGVFVWQKNDGTYTITNTTANTSGGPVSVQSVPTLGEGSFENWYGYTTNRSLPTALGDAPPVIQAASTGVSGITMFALCSYNEWCNLVNVTFDCNDAANAHSISGANTYSTNMYKITAKNCSNGALTVNLQCVYCRVTGTQGTTPAFVGGICYACTLANNFTAAFQTGVGTNNLFNNGQLLWSTVYGNSGAAAWVGNPATGGPSVISNNTFYNNGGDCLKVDMRYSTGIVTYVDNICESNAGALIDVTNNATVLAHSNASYHNSGKTTLGINGATQNINEIDYTATAFVSASSNNFALNNNSPGGAQLRCAGFPKLMPDGTNAPCVDPGALQHD
jgi:hypothetical protein